jgi:hypothetical protein
MFNQFIEFAILSSLFGYVYNVSALFKDLTEDEKKEKAVVLFLLDVFAKLFAFFVIVKLIILLENSTLTSMFVIVILYRIFKAIPESIQLHNDVVNRAN